MKSAFIRRRSGVQRNSNSTAPMRTRSPGFSRQRSIRASLTQVPFVLARSLTK